MKQKSIVCSQKNGITVNAYLGVEMVLLTMDMDQNITRNLAGFAIKCIPPHGEPFYLKNRLSFKSNGNFNGFTKDTKPAERKWFDSNESPFQYFRWLHVPAILLSGVYSYEVTPMYFGAGKKKLHLTHGPSVQVSFELHNNHPQDFEYGFTKGYLSSQAYADKFHNRDIRPPGPKTIDYDIKPFKSQYEWLGGKANKMLFDFLKDCAGVNAEVKALLYDCDHPEFIDYLRSFGNKLKVVLDNASLHHNEKRPTPEDRVFEILNMSTKQQIVRGKFGRFQHNKVLIKLVNGKAQKVFTGSANFSIRGLYAQANNCMIISNTRVADIYNHYFDNVYQLMHAKKSGLAINSNDITKKWFDVKAKNLPCFSVCLSPHKDAAVSLQKIMDEFEKANSSVLFSVMEISGGGEPLSFLRKLPDHKTLFHYGIIQSVKHTEADDESGDYDIIKQGALGGTVPFAYLKDKVPFPFQAEFSGGLGQVIHHKFIVVDFNSIQPVVFTGSSNLASGGETANGDNLFAIYDRDIAIAYGVEAIRLFDHYNFRNAMKNATTVKPLALSENDDWVKRYYDPADIKYGDRQLFANPVIE